MKQIVNGVSDTQANMKLSIIVPVYNVEKLKQANATDNCMFNCIDFKKKRLAFMEDQTKEL